MLQAPSSGDAFDIFNLFPLTLCSILTTGAEDMKPNTECPFPFWLAYNAHWNCHSIEITNNTWVDNLPAPNGKPSCDCKCQLINSFRAGRPNESMPIPFRFIILSTVCCNGKPIERNRILNLTFTVYSTPLYWISVICTSRFDYRRSHPRSANAFSILWSGNWNVGEWKHRPRR